MRISDWSSDVCSSNRTARRIEQDGLERDIPLEHVRVSDRLRVRPGERVPVDGAVVKGRTTIAESMVPGEPIPVEKATGWTVTRAEERRVGEEGVSMCRYP